VRHDVRIYVGIFLYRKKVLILIVPPISYYLTFMVLYLEAIITMYCYKLVIFILLSFI